MLTAKLIRFFEEPLLYLVILLLITVSFRSSLEDSIVVPTSGILPGYNYPKLKRLEGASDLRLKRIKGESTTEYIARLNMVVFDATWHCNPNKYNESAPNLNVFRIVGALYPEFQKSVKRQGVLTLDYGFYYCGFCHQNAEILTQTLIKNGINADTLAIKGHVITKVIIGGRVYFLDPDFGAGPFIKSKDLNLDYSKVYQGYIQAGANANLAQRITDMYKKSSEHKSYRGESVDKWNKLTLNPQKKGLFIAKIIKSAPNPLIFILLILISLRFLVLIRSKKAFNLG